MDPRLGADAGVGGFHGPHHRAFADPDVGQVRVRADLGAVLDHAVTLQHAAGQQGDFGGKLDVRVDVGVQRIPHRDPALHPAIVDPRSQHRFRGRELQPVVHPRRLVRVLEHDGVRDVPGLVQDGDEVREVVLVLGVLAIDPAQGRPEQARAHGHDRGVDLVNRTLLTGGVSLLDDALHGAVLGADDAPVAGGVLQVGGEDGQSGLALAVSRQQRAHRARAQERRVAGQDQHVAVIHPDLVLEGRQGDRHRMAGAQLLGLLDEGEMHVGAGALGQGLLDPGTAVPHHDHGRAGLLLGRGIQDVEHHWPPAEVVERLGASRAHARSLARGENHDESRSIHVHILSSHLQSIRT